VSDLAKSHAQVFIYLIFISSVMVRVMIKVRVFGLGSVVGLRLRLIIPTSCKSRTASNLAMRHIWHDIGTPVFKQRHYISVYTNYRCHAMSKTVGVKGNFRHFWSTEQHANVAFDWPSTTFHQCFIKTIHC